MYIKNKASYFYAYISDEFISVNLQCSSPQLPSFHSKACLRIYSIVKANSFHYTYYEQGKTFMHENIKL